MRKSKLTLEITDLKIPFKQSFKHHSAERSVTQSVLVVASDGEFKGYGEACPREYVTRESIQSVLSFFTENIDALTNQVFDLQSLKDYVETHKLDLAKNPSAWCAIELALLDLFAKQQHCSIEELLDIPRLEGSFFYTGVIGDGSMEAFEKMASQYIHLGFTDFKVKISGNPLVDFPKLSLLQRLSGDTCTIRLDANNIWSNIEDVINYLNEIPVKISGLEEPLIHKSISQLKSLANKIDVPLILDESFNHIEQFAELSGCDGSFIINLRVSKMGGMLNSLAIADKARKENTGLIIGAQVGETSILTRAALGVANFSKGHYKALEGAFGTHLLEHDLVEPPLMFGKAGELKPEKLLDQSSNGFQLAIQNERFY